ncbi:MAG: helix-turn-helix transcriptional regulator [Clostridiaceae bacterium]|nr:helix-turn-helix transcriptional regulator [Clostridiaceae bacterium]
MKRLFYRIISKISLFWRFFLILAVVVFLFAASLAAATLHFAHTLRYSYMEHLENQFQHSVAMFLRDVKINNQLPGFMERSDGFLPIRSAGRRLSPQNVYNLTMLHNAFTDNSYLMQLPSESFLYFRNSGVCLTRQRLFQEVESCFADYLVYDETVNLPEMLTSAKPEFHSGTLMLPAVELSIGGTAPVTALTMLVYPLTPFASAQHTVYGFIYPDTYFRERFQLDTLPADSFFQIVSTNGSTLLTQGNTVRENYKQLTYDIPSLSCKLVLGISDNHLQTAVLRSLTSALIILGISVAVGVALCFIFSHVGVSPLRKLVRAHAGEAEADSNRNELTAIDNFMSSTHAKNMALRNMLLSSFLVRVFAGLAVPKYELRQLENSFPLFRLTLRVAVIRECGADLNDTGDYFALSLDTAATALLDALPDAFIREHINMQETLLLFRDEPANLTRLHDLLFALNAGAGSQLRFIGGVSTPFIGLAEIGDAVRQAQACLSEADESILTIANDGGKPDDYSVVGSDELKQLRQALVGWNRDDVCTQINLLASLAIHSAEPSAEEIYYNVVFLLREAAAAARLSFASVETDSYSPQHSPDINLRRLKNAAEALFAQKTEQKESDRKRLCEAIVQHIRDNFSDPSLCMASLSKQFFVSERFIYSSILEVTGTTMSSFLTEVRMEEAARLLRETNESTTDIAEKCGYTVKSTFFRNFRKQFNVTPADYRLSSSASSLTSGKI